MIDLELTIGQFLWLFLFLILGGFYFIRLMFGLVFELIKSIKTKNK